MNNYFNKYKTLIIKYTQYKKNIIVVINNYNQHVFYIVIYKEYKHYPTKLDDDSRRVIKLDN